MKEFGEFLTALNSHPLVIYQAILGGLLILACLFAVVMESIFPTRLK